MPSFAINTKSGKQLLKELDLNTDKEKEFLIGNILPDVSRVKGYKVLDNHQKRKSVQDIKMVTHFRIKEDVVLSYPDLNKFLKKYEEEVKNNIISFAYFFHLYTDYYYFKVFLPSILTFYDKDMNITNNKNNVYYAKINRTNEIVEYKILFNKESNEGIYKDYSIANNYLLDKYKLNINYEELIEYIDEHGFNTKIKETNPLFAYYAIIKIRKYLEELKIEDTNLRIFTYNDLDNLVENIIDSFKKEYSYLMINYIKEK